MYSYKEDKDVLLDLILIFISYYPSYFFRVLFSVMKRDSLRFDRVVAEKKKVTDTNTDDTKTNTYTM